MDWGSWRAELVRVAAVGVGAYLAWRLVQRYRLDYGAP